MNDLEKRDFYLAARGCELKNGDYRSKADKFRKTVASTQTELEKQIYSPHPLYGFPSNDLALQNDPNLSPVIRSAIENRNQKIPVTSPSNDDDDIVLDTIQYKDESPSDYKDRMDNYINEAKRELSKTENDKKENDK